MPLTGWGYPVRRRPRVGTVPAPEVRARPRLLCTRGLKVTNPKPPQHLSRESKAFWRLIVADYVLEEHHLRLLRAACESWDRAQEARERLAADGIVVDSGRYGIRAHPAVAIEKDSRISFARLMRELDLEGEPGPDPRLPRR